MKRLLTAFTIISLFTLHSAAAPANPKPVNVTQPDGSILTLHVRGDEWGAWAETQDGYTVLKNTRGQWVYADLEENKLTPSYSMASENPPEFLQKHVHPVYERQNDQEPYKGPDRIPAFGIAALKQAEIIGTHEAIVILLNFTDNPRVNASQYTPSHYTNIYFNTTNNNSMYNFYVENSYGVFNLTGVIAGNKWYTSSQSMSYYGDNCAGIDNCYGSQTYDMICEALTLANADVDYSQYDKDADGDIDHVLIVHAAPDEAAHHLTNPEYIWSVRWTGSNICWPNSFDGKVARSGVVVAEDAEMGTPAHEFGHDIGAVDLYDTAQCEGSSTWEGIGEWGIMGSGNWLGSPQGSSPSHFSAWHKYFFGWIHPTIVNTPRYDEEIQEIELYDDAYIIPIPLGTSITNPSEGGSNEYFLIENRQKTGFDASQNGDGLLIWHIDDARYQSMGSSNCVNDYESNKGVDLEEADDAQGGGLDVPRSMGGDRGVSTDPWKNNATGFTDSSNPNSKAKDNSATQINLTDISASQTTMTADFLKSGTSGVEIHLENANVTPSSGNDSTTFNYTISYRHTNNTAPSYVNVTIDGTSTAMSPANASDTNYRDGKTYHHSQNNTLGNHNYSFSASDASITETTQTYVGPNVISADGPTVSLTTPPDNQTFTINTVPLSFNVVSLYNIINCSLLLNTSGSLDINETKTNVTVNSTDTFTVSLPEGRHLWTVECTDNYSQKNTPTTQTVNVDTTRPTTPTINTPQTYANTQNVTFSWSSSTDNFAVEYYLLQVATNTNFTNPTTYNTTETNQTTQNLSDATTYFLRVNAVDESGWEGNNSNTVNTTVDLSPPETPTIQSPNNTINEDTPTISWTTSVDATSGTANYTIQLSSNSNFSTLVYNTTTNASNTMPNTTLEDDTYFLRARATDNAQNVGEWANSNFTVKTIFINEVSPNAGWIELYNIESKNYSLTGWTLGSETQNYSLTEEIEALGHLLLNQTTTNISLNSTADSVLLYNIGGVLWDNVSFSSISGDESVGRSRDGIGDFTVFNENQTTPGAANTQSTSIQMANNWNLLSIPLIL